MVELGPNDGPQSFDGRSVNFTSTLGSLSATIGPAHYGWDEDAEDADDHVAAGKDSYVREGPFAGVDNSPADNEGARTEVTRGDDEAPFGTRRGRMGSLA